MKRTRLETLRVVSPCLEGWGRMTGDDRTRHCQRCEKNVFDVSQLSRDEAERLLERTNGDVCVRLRRRPDGSIVTRVNEVNPPVVPIRLRRAGPVAGAALGLALAVSGAAYAQEPVENQPVTDKPAVVALASKDEVTQTDGAFASVTGTVRRADGGATEIALTLVDEATGRYYAATVPGDGTFFFNNLPTGQYFLFAEATNQQFFPIARRRALTVGQNWRADLVLDKVTMEVLGGGGDFSDQPFQDLRLADVVFYGKVLSLKEVKTETVRDLVKEVDLELVTWRVTVKPRHVLKSGSLPGRVTFERQIWKGDPTTPVIGEEVLLFFHEMRGNELLSTQIIPISPRFEIPGRFKEFVELTRFRTPPRSVMVEWLVQGTIDPTTRSEAGCELARELREVKKDEDLADFEREWEAKNRLDPFRLSRDGDDFLTEAQKDRLTRALLETDSFGERDFDLLRIVLRFGNPKTVPYLLRQLRQQAGNPTEATTRLLGVLADSGGDERLKRFARLSGQFEQIHLSDEFDIPAKCVPGEKEMQLTAAREQAREELRAVIRAALWAYDHPEAP